METNPIQEAAQPPVVKQLAFWTPDGRATIYGDQPIGELVTTSNRDLRAMRVLATTITYRASVLLFPEYEVRKADA